MTTPRASGTARLQPRSSSSGVLYMVTTSPWKRAYQVLLAGAAAVALAAADDPKKPPAGPAMAPGGEAADVAQALQEAWPDHPEWVDMLTAILQDEPMSSTRSEEHTSEL